MKSRSGPIRKDLRSGSSLIAAIRELDDTRPVTQAICGFWDNAGKDWDYSAGAFEIQDIGGYNYQYLNYEGDHQKYPDRIMYGSETVPTTCLGELGNGKETSICNWRFCMDRDGLHR